MMEDIKLGLSQIVFFISFSQSPTPNQFSVEYKHTGHTKAIDYSASLSDTDVISPHDELYFISASQVDSKRGC